MQVQSRKLIPLVLGALALAGPAFAAEEPKSKEDEAAIEAKLEAARQRLEAAAREVAELSGQLSGPMIEEFQVMRRGEGRRAMLGVNLSDDSGDSKEGVRLESVSPGGPASDAGLKAGDVLTSIDGKSLRRSPEGKSGASLLVQHLRSVKPGDKVKLEYLRDGKSQKAEVVTESMDITRFVRAHPRVAPIPPVPPIPGEPYMGFRSFGGHGLHQLELVKVTPKLGQYFGTEKGVLVVRAPKESELKVEEGDVILDIGGREPQSGSHAMRILRSYQPGEKIAVNVLRNRKPVKLEYTMPEAEKMGDLFWFKDGDLVRGEGTATRPRAPKPAAKPQAPPAERT